MRCRHCNEEGHDSTEARLGMYCDTEKVALRADLARVTAERDEYEARSDAVDALWCTTVKERDEARQERDDARSASRLHAESAMDMLDAAHAERDALRADLARVTAERDQIADQATNDAAKLQLFKQERDQAIARAEKVEAERDAYRAETAERQELDDLHASNKLVCLRCGVVVNHFKAEAKKALADGKRLMAERDALRAEVGDLLAICDGTQSMLTQAERERDAAAQSAHDWEQHGVVKYVAAAKQRDAAEALLLELFEHFTDGQEGCPVCDRVEVLLRARGLLY